MEVWNETESSLVTNGGLVTICYQTEFGLVTNLQIQSGNRKYVVKWKSHQVDVNPGVAERLDGAPITDSHAARHGDGGLLFDEVDGELLVHLSVD